MKNKVSDPQEAKSVLETLRDANDHRRRPEKGRSSRPQHLTQCLTSRWGLGTVYGISDKILRGIWQDNTACHAAAETAFGFKK